MSDKEESIGQRFAEKTLAQEQGIGPAFVDKLEEKEPGIVDSTIKAVRGRAGTATESLTQTFSRLSTTLAETASEYGLTAPAAGSLGAALAGMRAKDIAVPGLELVTIEANQKVGELEQLLRREKIHSVPVFNASQKRFEGVVDTADLLTWCVNKFPKSQLDAWSTFREEQEFKLQPVREIVDASWRNHIHTTAPDTTVAALLEKFRNRDVHRVFIHPNPADKALTAVVTQTDVVRFLHKATFDLKEVRVGEKIHSKKVVSCFEGELAVSAFRLMDHAAVSAVAVVDDKGKLVGAITSYDVVSGSQESIVSVLYKPLLNFIGRDKPNAKEPISVKTNATFAHVLELMATNHILHVFIIDDDGYPTGIITVRDIVEAFLAKKAE